MNCLEHSICISLKLPLIALIKFPWIYSKFWTKVWRTKWIVGPLRRASRSKTNSFVHFLEEFTSWQFAFEIIWPLINLVPQWSHLEWKYLWQIMSFNLCNALMYLFWSKWVGFEWFGLYLIFWSSVCQFNGIFMEMSGWLDVWNTDSVTN